MPIFITDKHTYETIMDWCNLTTRYWSFGKGPANRQDERYLFILWLFFHIQKERLVPPHTAVPRRWIWQPGPIPTHDGSASTLDNNNDNGWTICCIQCSRSRSTSSMNKRFTLIGEDLTIRQRWARLMDCYSLIRAWWWTLREAKRRRGMRENCLDKCLFSPRASQWRTWRESR